MDMIMWLLVAAVVIGAVMLGKKYLK